MLNHKGFTLIEMLLAIMLVSSAFMLYVSVEMKILRIDQYHSQEKIGLYLAEHIQSMVLLQIDPFHKSSLLLRMTIDGHIDENGEYEVILDQRYVTITNLQTEFVVFEGII